MNQILVTETKHNGNKKKMSINSALQMFAIILIVFGIGMSATGAYGFYKSLSDEVDNQIVVLATEPIITIERVDVDTINIVVTHDKGISTVTYTINGGSPEEILGDGQLEVKKEVKLQNGNSTISVIAKDVNGVTSTYETEQSVEKQAVINLTPQDGKVQAAIENEIPLSYIEYYWDDDLQNAVHIDIENNENTAEISIDVLKGIHELTVKVVDTEEKETTKKQKIDGANKPEVAVRTDGEYFYVVAVDDDTLEKIEITLNGGETITKEINGKQYAEKIKLDDVDVNRIVIVAYNNHDLSAIKRVQHIRE